MVGVTGRRLSRGLCGAIFLFRVSHSQCLGKRWPAFIREGPIEMVSKLGLERTDAQRLRFAP